ncbi:hypothetical protein C1645_788522 [Glomus cerebriforme]|uniref:Uncharacterized protein n=1 Tax=Glomus cerebriforme TaxID=658196 RepID=A0A397S8Q2_9GLOM|nr:hypothetical protein C1645_788522 [Glomus cerebriforme]
MKFLLLVFSRYRSIIEREKFWLALVDIGYIIFIKLFHCCNIDLQNFPRLKRN